MSEPPPAPASASHHRVLFVDDDVTFLGVLKELMGALSGGTWEVLAAESASQAFTVLQNQPVDLVVIDVQMKVMDGIQLLSLLNRGYPNVQKVVLTGFANENYRAACLSNGAELFLEKPAAADGWENLYTALNELLRFKPEKGFRGVLRRVELTDVLQMECLARSSSLLEIGNAKMRGTIYIAIGQIVHAELGEQTGEDAFNRLMGLSGGHFNLKPFVEPPVRTISGQWEFLLMEAARKRDEADAAEPPPPPTEADFAPPPMARERLEELLAGLPQPGATPVIAEAPAPPPEVIPTSLLAESAPGLPGQPVIEEMLICSAQGEILHEWQCRNAEVWVSFFEFVSRKAQRLAESLTLGEFNRLEIQGDVSRTVVIIAADRGVMVQSRREGG